MFTCTTRNIHNFSQKDIEKIHLNWEPTPNHYNKLDLRSFLQDQDIEEVQMEDAEEEQPKAGCSSSSNNDEKGEVRISGLRRQLEAIRKSLKKKKEEDVKL